MGGCNLQLRRRRLSTWRRCSRPCSETARRSSPRNCSAKKSRVASLRPQAMPCKMVSSPHVQGPGHAFNGSDVTTLPDIHLPGVDLHDSSPGLLVGVGQLDLSVQSAFRHDNQNVNAWCSILMTTLPHFSLQGRGEFTPDLSRAGSRMSTRLVAAITWEDQHNQALF